MSCYLLAAIDIEDSETYQLYLDAGTEAVANWPDAELLAMDDAPFVLEGTSPAKRIVMVKFGSEKDLKDYYYSDKYQAAAKIRQRSAHTPFLVGVHGYEG